MNQKNGSLKMCCQGIENDKHLLNIILEYFLTFELLPVLSLVVRIRADENDTNTVNTTGIRIAISKSTVAHLVYRKYVFLTREKETNTFYQNKIIMQFY